MTYYEILEVRENASYEVINMAYKALCKKYHPDVSNYSDEYTTEKMSLINEAYSVLSNPKKRQAYDESLKFSQDNQKDSKHDEEKDSKHSSHCTAETTVSPEAEENTFTSSNPTQDKEKNKYNKKAIWISLIATIFILIGIAYLSQESSRNAIYQEALSLYENGNYLESYELFSSLDQNYKDVSSIVIDLKEDMYQLAASAYRAEFYPIALDCLYVLGDYKDSNLYINLIKAKATALLENAMLNEEDPSELYKETQLKIFEYCENDYFCDEKLLINNLDFEDTKSVALCDSLVAKEFLQGSWYTKNGTYYFIMTEGHTYYNLPATSINDATYSIHDSLYVVIDKNKKKYKLFEFDVIDRDSIMVYCYKNKGTYTLYKQ